jgi:3-deoxy-7-phosphoheptulonate synthase
MLVDIPTAAARQQPEWTDAARLAAVRADLASRAGLVDADAVLRLRSWLGVVAEGGAHVVQAGDCAESFAECTADYVVRKAGLVDMLAGVLKMITRTPVVRVGRIAGQFAKPRSSAWEQVNGQVLPAYRGDSVNCAEPDPDGRRPDPSRLLGAYDAASAGIGHLGWQAGHDIDNPLWTSHEALLLDYELPLLRRTAAGGVLLSSTHWPWIGDRTRQLDGPHVALLAGVVNPVACKVGPGMTAGELLGLCARLDPGREPGRLTLIARLGAEAVAAVLPPLVAAVRAAGHPVVWLTDPMHGNTVRTPDGLKTRFLEVITQEVREFQEAVRAAGGVAGGLHLETTPDDVTECVRNHGELDQVADKYTTLCDPRLTARQAVSVVSAWSG